jgi:hypothetical protein
MRPATEFPSEHLLEKALDISRRRKDILLRLKAAIRSQDLKEADQLITELVPDEESNRTDTSLYRVAGRKR